MSKDPKKVVVFDLDETLGYFIEFSIFCDSLQLYNKRENREHSQDSQQHSQQHSQKEFNKLLDLYPEFVRPNILPILKYLKRKTESGECSAVMIYTNNTGPKEWAHKIKSYFETKIDFQLFAQIIGAFKVQGKRIEICRTTYDKTINDFIKCTKLPKETQICYLDDVYYPNMNYENVYYIKVKPYIHDLTFHEMIERYIKSPLGEKVRDENEFTEFMNQQMKEYVYAYVEKTKEEVEIDKIITKQIMIYIQDFFHHGPNGLSVMNETDLEKVDKNRNKNKKTKRWRNSNNKTKKNN